jgi:hypothetical protein
MRLRFADIQANTTLLSLVDMCPDDPRLIELVNGFEQRAAAFGRWWGSTQLVQFCVTGSDCGACIVLPPQVATIEAANLNGVPVNVQGSSWGQFLRPHLYPAQCNGSSFANNLPCTGVQNFRCGCGCGCAGVPQLQDEGLVASYSVTLSGDRIKLYATNAADVGLKVVVQGNDSNGIWVRTTIDGTVQDGEQVTLSLTGTLTNTTWGAGAPFLAYKEATSYRVLMFAVDSDDNERQLAEYGPSETNPTYRKVRIPGLRGTCGTGNLTFRTLVSLQPGTVTGPNDWLLFADALPAYSDGLMAEKLYRNLETVAADSYFFGNPRPARNARGVLRHSMGMGALGYLESNLRKYTADKTAVRVQRDGLALQGFV